MTLLTNCTAIVVCCLLRYLNNDSTSYNTLIGTCINYTYTTNKQNRNIKSWNLHLFDIVMGFLFRQTLKALAREYIKDEWNINTFAMMTITTGMNMIKKK